MIWVPQLHNNNIVIISNIKAYFDWHIDVIRRHYDVILLDSLAKSPKIP